MFRQLTQKFALFSIFVSMTVAASGGPLKVATVDMMKLLNEFHEKKAVEAEERVDLEDIRKADDGRVTVIQGIMQELQKLQNEFNDPSLSPEKRDSIAAVANEKQTTLAALQEDREEVLNRRRRELNQKMLGLINEIRSKVMIAVNAYAATQDVDYVFDESGLTTSQVPFLIYVRNRVDLTEAVLEKLNKDAPLAPEAEETSK